MGRLRAFEKFTIIGAFIAGINGFNGVAVAADEAGAKAANQSFYAALNKIFEGDVAPMQAIWSHASDVTYMGPTGQYEIGWANVAKDWDGQASRKLGGHVAPVQTNMIISDAIAVVSTIEQGENTNAAGKTERLSLRATNVFRREQGAWKMIAHHTDPLPYLKR